MDTRVALIGLLFEEREVAPKINSILHEYEEYIVGRMGVPNAGNNTHVISIVINGQESDISALSGKLGRVDGVTAKVIYDRKKC